MPRRRRLRRRATDEPVTAPAGAGAPIARLQEWAPPRGPRSERGRWQWSLESRPAVSYRDVVELYAVAAYRHLAAGLVTARTARGWSLRRLAVEAEPLAGEPKGTGRPGIALSALTGLEQGSCWPDMDTAALVAQTLGHRLQLIAPALPSLRVLPRFAGPDYEYAATYDLHEQRAVAVALRTAWRDFATFELGLLASWNGWSHTGLGRALSLRPNTMSDLFRGRGRKADVSLKTLLAVAVCVRTGLEVVPRDAPWPQRQP